MLCSQYVTVSRECSQERHGRIVVSPRESFDALHEVRTRSLNPPISTEQVSTFFLEARVSVNSKVASHLTKVWACAGWRINPRKFRTWRGALILKVSEKSAQHWKMRKAVERDEKGGGKLWSKNGRHVLLNLIKSAKSSCVICLLVLGLPQMTTSKKNEFNHFQTQKK